MASRCAFHALASVDPRQVEPVGAPDGRELVVAHAPTDRDVKGTRHVVEAVDSLRSEGVALRLDLIEGVTRSEVLERLAAADLVVDQLLMGWYGAFAVEAMAIGRPVFAHIREEEPEDNPFGDALPIVRSSAATLAQELRALASRPRPAASARSGRKALRGGASRPATDRGRGSGGSGRYAGLGTSALSHSSALSARQIAVWSPHEPWARSRSMASVS